MVVFVVNIIKLKRSVRFYEAEDLGQKNNFVGYHGACCLVVSSTRNTIFSGFDLIDKRCSINNIFLSFWLPKRRNFGNENWLFYGARTGSQLFCGFGQNLFHQFTFLDVTELYWTIFPVLLRFVTHDTKLCFVAVVRWNHVTTKQTICVFFLFLVDDIVELLVGFALFFCLSIFFWGFWWWW